MYCCEENIDIIPDPNTEYRCSPFTESNGFTYLMKLVLSYKNNEYFILDKINELLNKEPDSINFKNKKEWTALMLACRNSNTWSSLEVVKCLLNRYNVNINDKTDKGWTALMMACLYSNENSSLETVNCLLNRSDINVNEKDNEGWTALMFACRHSNKDSSLEVVKRLLNRSDINVNEKEIDGWTALMIACRYSNEESSLGTVQCLLNRNDINVNEKSKGGFTALILACRNSNIDSSLETVKCLLNRSDININEKDIEGWTALMSACRYSNTESSLETVKCLLNRSDINVNEKNNKGWTALMLACSNSNTDSSLETVKCLLNRNDINVNEKNNYGNTALSILCTSENISIDAIKALLSRANVDVEFSINKLMDNLAKSNKINDIISSLINTSVQSAIIRNIVERKLYNILLDYDSPKIVINLFVQSYIYNPAYIDGTVIAKISSYMIAQILPRLCALGYHIELLNDLLKYSTIEQHHIHQIYHIYGYYKNRIIKNIADHRLMLLSHPTNTIGLCDKYSGASTVIDSNDLFNLKEFDKLKLLFDTTDINILSNKIDCYLEYIEKIE